MAPHTIRRSGINPLDYMGVNPSTPYQFVINSVAPTSDDINFNIGTIWEYYKDNDPSDSDVYILVRKSGSVATWVLFGTSGNDLRTLTGNTGGAVGGDVSNNINVIGGSNVAIAGNPGTSTLTARVSGTTNHAVQIGNASGTLTSLTIGTNGQALIGATGADPAFASLTSTAGSLTYITGLNLLSINLASFIPTTSWTPTLNFGGATTGITYTTRQGFYSRIGKTGFFIFTIHLSSKGSAIGSAQITGLPLNPAGATALALRLVNMNFVYVFGKIVAFMNSGNDIRLQDPGDTGGGSGDVLDNGDFSDTSFIQMSGIIVSA